jgi:hypothetical protein
MTVSTKDQGFSMLRMTIKGVLLFIAINLLFAIIKPLPSIAKVSGYNSIFPGRVRLPYGEKPEQAYNFSLYSLEAMFASHEVAGDDKSDGEYRIILVGDSSVWGYLLKPEETLAAYINDAGIQLDGGRSVRAYNLGYPTISLAKDLLILNSALEYNPDLIIWNMTLDSFPQDKQIDSPIVQNNPGIMKSLFDQLSLDLNDEDPRFRIPSFWQSTLTGQRRSLADIFRLQLYGVSWAATVVDQYYPDSFDPPQEDLEAEPSFYGLQPPRLNPDDLSFDILEAGVRLAKDVPIIFINEPIFISHGQNSDVRYNFFYPRWAYDQYRQLLTEKCNINQWQCLDVWDLVPPQEFTNSAIHMTPAGTRQLATEMIKAIQSIDKP